ncbi:MAG TPA: hypothetical protein VKV20_05145 [Ktedonobacteraceae bacterium]|nr:hypothetical protein [Ktedonobacteraceae bacterium]
MSICFCLAIAQKSPGRVAPYGPRMAREMLPNLWGITSPHFLTIPSGFMVYSYPGKHKT